MDERQKFYDSLKHYGGCPISQLAKPRSRQSK